MIFRYIVGFTLNENKYEMYICEKNKKLAFLKDIGNEHLVYPNLRELVELTMLFTPNHDIFDIKKDIKKRFRFIPKVKYNGTLLLLTASLLAGCSNIPLDYDDEDTLKPTKEIEYNIPDVDVSAFDEEIPEFSKENLTHVAIKTPAQNINFKKLLAPADDEYDFLYASDYVKAKYIKETYLRDATSVQKVFELERITLNDIKDICEKNTNIKKKYKDFIIEYAADWLKMWPNTNFSCFYINLHTLKVKEISQEELSRITLSQDSRACYVADENTIYLLKGIELSKENDGYIEFTHELSHAARKFKIKDSNTEEIYRADYFEDYYLGNYTVEGLITVFSYKLQGLNKDSVYYKLLCNYSNIILDVIDYDGADYMNHSINFLIDKMNDYMKTDEAAYILAQIEAQASLKFKSYASVAYTEFSDLYTYLVKMYMNKYLQEEMSYDDAKLQFDKFYGIISCNIPNIYNSYGINEESFIQGFEESLEKFNIQKTERKR